MLPVGIQIKLIKQYVGPGQQSLLHVISLGLNILRFKQFTVLCYDIIHSSMTFHVSGTQQQKDFPSFSFLSFCFRNQTPLQSYHLRAHMYLKKGCLYVHV